MQSDQRVRSDLQVRTALTVRPDRKVQRGPRVQTDRMELTARSDHKDPSACKV